MENKKSEVKIIKEVEISFQEKRKIEIEFIKIIKENRLSLNQAEELLNSVKENLNRKPLWINK